MMGRQERDQRQLFYEFSLDEMIPKDHLLRRINVFATAVLLNAGSTPPSVFARLSKVQSVDQRIAQPDSCTAANSIVIYSITSSARASNLDQSRFLRCGDTSAVGLPMFG